MTNHLTKLAVVLCILVQAWAGCAGGSGRTLCLSLHWHGSIEREAGADAEHGGCGHDHGDGRGHDHGPLPVPVPAHDHGGDCCIDIPLSDLGGPPQPRFVSAKVFDGFAGFVVADGVGVGRGDFWFVASARRIERGPPDLAHARASVGALTTRLRL